MLKHFYIGFLLISGALNAGEWHSSQLWFKDYNNPYPNTNYTYQLHAQKWHFMHYDVERFNDSFITAADRAIERQIRNIMREENFIDAENIAVIVQNGRVTLRGTTYDPQLYEKIQEQISNIDGINKFKSHVIIYANYPVDR